MAELIYHNPSDRTGVSPFDRAIRDITEDEEILIACPYIGPAYLRDVLNRTEKWYLLTDVSEWLGIHSRAKRGAIHEFLVEHRDRVRHITDLHAKVVIGNGQALIGSANFTTKGLTKRTEMSVLVDEQKVVDELRGWYELLWSRYNSPDIERVEEYLKTASPTPTTAQNQQRVSFSTSESPGTASLVNYSDRETGGTETEESYAKLVQRIANAPSAEWIDSYFDLLDDLISATGLPSDDSRLVTSLPSGGGIHVSINNRYVLTAFREVSSRTEFIVSSDVEGVDVYIEQADRAGRFDPLYSEPDSKRPWFVGFDNSLSQIEGKNLRNAWTSAAIEELDRATASPYKQYHEPAVYRAARDRGYRRQVIREAFD